MALGAQYIYMNTDAYHSVMIEKVCVTPNLLRNYQVRPNMCVVSPLQQVSFKKSIIKILGE